MQRVVLLNGRHVAAAVIAISLVLVGVEAQTATPETTVVTVRARSAAKKETPADVLINGKRLGTAPLTLSLQAGRYLVEVSAKGHTMWRQWLDAVPGKPVTLDAALEREQQAPAAKTAMLVVTANDLEATVFVDGKSLGQVPAVYTSATGGTHEVEVRSAAGAKATQTVTLKPGITAKVRLRVVTNTKRPAESEKVATAENQRTADADNAAIGSAGGAAVVPAAKTESTETDQDGDVPPETPVPADGIETPPPVDNKGTLTVRSGVRGAEVFVDGTKIGATPVSARVLKGPHVVSVRHPDYEEFLTTVEVSGDSATVVDAALQQRKSVVPQKAAIETPANTTKTAVEDDVDLGLMSTFAAHLVEPTRIAADFALGFPYLFEARLTTGFVDWGAMGMDGGVDLRTYGALTELGVRGRLRVFQRDPWAVATEMTIGGGGGPHMRNTFFMTAGATGSVRLWRRLFISTSLRLHVYSDRLCPDTATENELGACSQPPDGISLDEVRDRFSGLRVEWSGSVEYTLTNNFAIFGLIEVAPFQNDRRAFQDAFADIMPNADPGVYGRIGVVIKR